MKRYRITLVVLVALAVAVPVVAQMSRVPSKTPESIGKIVCVLQDTDGTLAGLSAECRIPVRAVGDDEPMVVDEYDMRDAGTADVKRLAVQFLDAVRAQAEAEVLPS